LDGKVLPGNFSPLFHHFTPLPFFTPFMKHFLLVLLLSSVTIHFSYSQVTLGAKAGAQVAGIHYQEPSPDADLNPRLGYFAGLFAQINPASKWLLRSELLFSVKGAQVPARPGVSKGKVSLNYLNVPVLIGYQPLPQVTVYLGPEMGYLLAAQGRSGDDSQARHNVTDFYKRVDLGLAAGVSYQLTPVLQADVRFVRGGNMLIEYNRVDEDGFVTEKVKDGRNQVFQLGLHYKFLSK
jgi:outer membrane immunogenic protein